jgi:myosin heavy subunit
MTVLGNTEPHFIRAIKPNDKKMPGNFDSNNALRQLRYTGILETIKIRQLGYPVRPSYSDFLDRFKILVEKLDEKMAGKSDREKCEELVKRMEDFGIDRAKMQFGATKLFMRQQQFDLLHDLREERLAVLAKRIQDVWRTYYLTKRFRDLRKSALVFQAGNSSPSHFSVSFPFLFF